jgi:hypothetical protein
MTGLSAFEYDSSTAAKSPCDYLGNNLRNGKRGSTQPDRVGSFGIRDKED